MTNDAYAHLTTVADEIEAERLCSLLRSEGIDSMQLITDIAAAVWGATAVGGAREVLVRRDQLDGARMFLARRDASR